MLYSGRITHRCMPNQNCSNGVLFGTKELYMTCMNGFVLDNAAKVCATDSR